MKKNMAMKAINKPQKIPPSLIITVNGEKLKQN